MWYTCNQMEISWDPRKAEINLRKHGISFEGAASVIQSAMTVTIEDDSSLDEQRFVTIGVFSQTASLNGGSHVPCRRGNPDHLCS